MTAVERVKREIMAIGAKIESVDPPSLGPKNITEAIITIYPKARSALTIAFLITIKVYTFSEISQNENP